MKVVLLVGMVDFFFSSVLLCWSRCLPAGYRYLLVQVYTCYSRSIFTGPGLYPGLYLLSRSISAGPGLFLQVLVSVIPGMSLFEQIYIMQVQIYIW